MASKLGPHCLRSTLGASAMLAAGAKIIKLVDDFGLVSQVPAGVTLIGRSYSAFTAESQRDDDPWRAANYFVDSQLDEYQANPLIKLWEGHNEPVWNTPEDMDWYAQFEVQRLAQMSLLGLRCVIGNFSTGGPDLPLWNNFLPAIWEALRRNGVLGLHEYSSPWMWWLTGKYQLDPNGDAGNTGWTTLRYRKVINEYLKPAGLQNIPIIITECGLDRIGQVRSGMASGNWRTDAAWWDAENSAGGPIPYDPNHERYYAEQLKWYDAQLREDPTVIGATIFTVGSYGPPWSDYDIDGTHVIQYLCDYIKAEAGTGDMPPVPIPVPIPPEENNMPIDISVLDFNKTYAWDARPGAPEPGNTILIPQNVGFEYVHDPNVRVTWQDIKQGSPTYGQMRTSDNAFTKPEVMPKLQDQMPDVPFPIGVPALSKCFKGYTPIWVLYTVALNMTPGNKYKLSWPVWPNLLVSDDGSNKVYADDPAAGWLRLRVKAGDVALTINAAESPNRSWYCGLDFAYGHWFVPQVVIDATQSVMTIALECVSIFGLKDSDFMIAPPALELISGNPVPEPPPVQVGTLRVLAQMALVSSHQGVTASLQVLDAVNALNNLVG